MRIGFLEIVFVFLFIDMFDNIGTLLAVGKKAGLFDKAHQIPRVNRILLADATATMVGSLTGTSTVASYIESAAGVAAGGRTGVTAIVTGAALRGRAVRGAGGRRHSRRRPPRPALIVVGSLMMSVVAEMQWSDPEVGVPAFLTMMAIPLTFSIANGLAFGFTAFTLMKVLRGKFRAGELGCVRADRDLHCAVCLSVAGDVARNKIHRRDAETLRKQNQSQHRRPLRGLRTLRAGYRSEGIVRGSHACSLSVLSVAPGHASQRRAPGEGAMPEWPPWSPPPPCALLCLRLCFFSVSLCFCGEF